MMTASTSAGSERNNYRSIGYMILGEKKKNNFFWGNYIEYKVKFFNGKEGEVYKGEETGKYFYYDIVSGKDYFDTFEQAVNYLYRCLRK